MQVAHPRHRAGACTLNAVGLLPVSRAWRCEGGSPPLAPPLCVCGDVYLTLARFSPRNAEASPLSSTFTPGAAIWTSLRDPGTAAVRR